MSTPQLTDILAIRAHIALLRGFAETGVNTIASVAYYTIVLKTMGVEGGLTPSETERLDQALQKLSHEENSALTEASEEFATALLKLIAGWFWFASKRYPLALPYELYEIACSSVPPQGQEFWQAILAEVGPVSINDNWPFA